MLEFKFYWNGQETGVVTRRATFEVGHCDGMHARPCAQLYARLRVEVPHARVELRVVGDDEFLDCRSINSVTMRLIARRGDRIEVRAKADKAELAEKALSVAGEVIEAAESSSHWETGGELIRAGHPLDAYFLRMCKDI